LGQSGVALPQVFLPVGGRFFNTDVCFALWLVVITAYQGVARSLIGLAHSCGINASLPHPGESGNVRAEISGQPGT
jgi:hypothetical protein